MAHEIETTARQQMDELLARIAKKHLRIETLEARGADHLDFHNCGVLGIKDALVEAFKAGMTVGVDLVQK